MARGSKKSYTSKQRRQASHIEESAKKSGKSAKTAARIAYATVNKQDGGGKKSGSGRGKKRDTSSSRKGGRKGGRKTASRRGASRKSASRK
jgi:hypothetical protein